MALALTMTNTSLAIVIMCVLMAINIFTMALGNSEQRVLAIAQFLIFTVIVALLMSPIQLWR